MGWSVDGRLIGWVGGWRSSRECVSAFVPVGGRAVIFFGTTAVFLFSPLHNRPALAKLEYEATHPFAAALL